jgi:dimethylargininase
MFRYAIVRIPGRNIKEGLASVSHGIPDYVKACEQHTAYVEALRNLGLKVRMLDENERYPDSTFIEDVALCTSECAILTNPGAASRRGEIEGMMLILEEYYDKTEQICHPGTLEAGDVMMVGDHFYIGISGRTNSNGADQLITILEKYKFSCTKVPLKNMLHLKSGVSYLENNNILVAEEFVNNKVFAKFNRILVGKDERYAANSLWINGKVIVPKGFPKTRKKVEKAGYETICLDVSEFKKLDGGLSCLSLRF